MPSFSSLAGSAIALFVLAAFSSPVFATDWYKVSTNPIVNAFDNQPFVNSPFNYPLSGFVDHQDESASAGFAIFLHQAPAPDDTVFAYNNGAGYYLFTSELPSPLAYPYVVRLSTAATGDRIYAFYQNQQDATQSLYAVYTDVADYPGGPVESFNDWSDPVLVYTDQFDNIEEFSVTSLNNETIYIAIKYDTDLSVQLISTNDFITFTEEGQFSPRIGSPVTVYPGFTVFAANDPSDPSGPEILWFHWVDAVKNVPFISYTSKAEPRVLQAPFIEVGNFTLRFQIGVTSAVSNDGSNVMLLRVGSEQGTYLTPSFLYYSIFNINTMKIVQDEIQLTGLDGSVPQTGAMPTLISSRYAGDAIQGKPVVLAWANWGDNLIYSFAGSPF